MTTPSLVLHWFWPAFFVAFGIFMGTRGRYFASVGAAFCNARFACSNTADANRLRAAVARRQNAEGAPAPLGLAIAAICLVLAGAALSGRVQTALLYALMCLSMAGICALAFLRLRNSQPTRVAVLTARRAESVIPSYWLLAAAVSAFSTLVFWGRPEYRVSAILVCISSVVSLTCAWRLTALPALLTGIDVPAEQVIDDRLRMYRSSAALLYAVVQVFVFCSQASPARGASALQVTAYAISTLVWVGFSTWLLRRQFAVVRLA